MNWRKKYSKELYTEAFLDSFGKLNLKPILNNDGVITTVTFKSKEDLQLYKLLAKSYYTDSPRVILRLNDRITMKKELSQWRKKMKEEGWYIPFIDTFYNIGITANFNINLNDDTTVIFKTKEDMNLWRLSYPSDHYLSTGLRYRLESDEPFDDELLDHPDEGSDD